MSCFPFPFLAEPCSRATESNAFQLQVHGIERTTEGLEGRRHEVRSSF